MKITFEPLSDRHARPVMEIFNHYVANSFAAYPENKLPVEFFAKFPEMSQGYPAYAIADDSGTVLGFCMLRPYSPFPVFRRTAVISYFLAPDRVRQGIGRSALARLEADAKNLGIRNLLAGISSLNDGSIAFHRSMVSSNAEG